MVSRAVIRPSRTVSRASSMRKKEEEHSVPTTYSPSSIMSPETGVIP